MLCDQFFFSPGTTRSVDSGFDTFLDSAIFWWPTSVPKNRLFYGSTGSVEKKSSCRLMCSWVFGPSFQCWSRVKFCVDHEFAVQKLIADFFRLVSADFVKFQSKFQITLFYDLHGIFASILGRILC